jgi:hypothetical protein
MKNNQVIKSFVEGATIGKSTTGNLFISGNKLINYSTVIATRKENKIYLNNNHYSQTTSKIQNMIRKSTNSIIEITESQIKNIA